MIISQVSYRTNGPLVLVRHCYIWTPKDFQNFFFIIMIFIPYPKTHVGIAIVHDENVGQSQGYFKISAHYVHINGKQYSAQMILTLCEVW